MFYHYISYIYTSDFGYINCIMNCNIVPNLSYPILLLLQIILYIHLKLWNVLTVLSSVILSNIHIINILLLLQVILCVYVCIYIYIYIFLNILTVLSNVMLSHIHIFPYCVINYCIYIYIYMYIKTLWNILNILTVIFSYIYIFLTLCY